MSLREIRYTLLADGTSDNVLLNHITWLLRQHTSVAIQPNWADFSRLPKRPYELRSRIQAALDLFPCDLLFVHRDAERELHTTRSSEIHAALASAGTMHPAVCVVPVRMQEAWLLFDEPAIRRAAGNPNGRMPLVLPRMSDLESTPNPKETLHTLLKTASGLHGRRLQSFEHRHAARLIGEHIEDFSPLRRLPAFRTLEDDIQTALASLLH